MAYAIRSVKKGIGEQTPAKLLKIIERFDETYGFLTNRSGSLSIFFNAEGVLG